ncbi:Sodium-coupled neutral amino acid transporter 9 [Araneus ventricosus]|uniref:Sodium-coupled neutral amino acid transporter 9 n=1 Tax=Araneus ventricosus TaxID=182803 RepID=A0A4Y2MD81_ARAVE|nr:Sodium-coupled neutral amino acid transporter 9 [Araneus ventricosus]
MEPDVSTPLLTPDESVNHGLNTEDEVSSDSSNSTDNPHRKRRPRLPFHYPHVHKSARMRREAGSRGIATYHRYRYYNRLTDPTIDTLSIPDHVVPHTFLFPLSTILAGKQGSLVAIFSIWNTMMGSSLLSMPWAIQEAGFAAGLIILFVMGGLCFYTAYRIVSLRTLAELPSSAVEFPDLCRLLLGPWAERIATFFSLIPLLGGAIVYWVLMSNFMYFIGVYTYESFHVGVNSSNVDNTSFPDVYCPASLPVNETFNLLSHDGNSTSDVFYNYWNMQRTIPFYIAIFFIPFVSLKSPTFFSKLNALGTLAVIVLIAFIITKGVIWGINFNTFDLTSINYVHLFKATFPVLVGTLSLSFFIHNCVLSLLRNQKKPENNPRDLAIAYVLVGTTYLIVGGVFFVTFPLQKDCIEDSHDKDGTWADTSLSKFPHHINDGIFDSRCQIVLGLHTRQFSLESGFESGTIRPQS